MFQYFVGLLLDLLGVMQDLVQFSVGISHDDLLAGISAPPAGRKRMAVRYKVQRRCRPHSFFSGSLQRTGLGVFRATGVEVRLQQDLGGDAVTAILALAVRQAGLP